MLTCIHVMFSKESFLPHKFWNKYDETDLMRTTETKIYKKFSDPKNLALEVESTKKKFFFPPSIVTHQ